MSENCFGILIVIWWFFYALQKVIVKFAIPCHYHRLFLYICLWHFNVVRKNCGLKSSDKISAHVEMSPQWNVLSFSNRMTMFPLFIMFVGFGKSCPSQGYIWKSNKRSTKDVPVGINQTMKLNLFFSHVWL